MVVEKEGTFEVGGHSLYTKSWLPGGLVKAKLIFIHGFSDHVNRYNPFFTALAARGIAVHGFDQRGWGRSVRKPAEKGLTGPTSQVLADIVAFIKPHLAGEEPVFVMGHSMGGGQVLTLLGEAQYEDSVLRKVRGWLLESPFVSFSPEEEPSWFKIFAGRLAGRLLPHHQLVHKIAPENLTRDPKVAESIKADTLMHDTGTLEGLSGLLDRTTALAKGAVRPRQGGVVKALWIGHGTKDKTTFFEASKKYFDECTGHVEDREFKAYEGWYHQLHADGPDSEEFYRDVADWILKRSGGGEAAPVVVGGEGKTEAKL
ncbi:Alpha/Beta hydrolase protein [Podospora australis]|uniref:Alpha/Beta hydrolase protein n=1 Tax=Podospora australis TaxID=1536484 RepID=A0AAN6X2Q1_9PEZI|nr:Alpha/Beta hydrolase protein [Podospora australis]